VWAVGEMGGILHWNGTAWSQSASGADNPPDILFGVWGSGAGDVWTVGGFGTILHH
jgi:hypothetical protein